MNNYNYNYNYNLNFRRIYLILLSLVTYSGHINAGDNSEVNTYSSLKRSFNQTDLRLNENSTASKRVKTENIEEEKEELEDNTLIYFEENLSKSREWIKIAEQKWGRSSWNAFKKTLQEEFECDNPTIENNFFNYVKNLHNNNPKKLEETVLGGFTIAHYAACKGFITVISFLHQHCPTIYSQCSSEIEISEEQWDELDEGDHTRDCKTIGHVAAEWGHLNIIRYISQNDSEFLEKQDGYHSTLIYDAIRNRRLNIIRYLHNNHPIFLGKSFKKMNNIGTALASPTYLISRLGYIEFIEFFCINYPNEYLFIDQSLCAPIQLLLQFYSYKLSNEKHTKNLKNMVMLCASKKPSFLFYPYKRELYKSASEQAKYQNMSSEVIDYLVNLEATILKTIETQNDVLKNVNPAYLSKS